MRNPKRNAFLICNLFFGLQWFPGIAQDDMFRGNPAHHKISAGYEQAIFNRVRWAYRTHGAIRSTALVIRHLAYIGSTDGFLYALNTRNGEVRWKYPCGSAVLSSPAYSDGYLYILTEKQELISIGAADGKKKWQLRIGADRPYGWGFDYYFPSPVVRNDSLWIASADGVILCIDKKNGRRFWQTRLPSFVRATPAIAGGWLYIGDTTGDMHALDAATGKEKWTFHTEGYRLNNDSFGFDRKAIISSAVIEDDDLVFGGRDGYLYALNRITGELIWKFDHKVSWVISSPGIWNHAVITGSSDGHFVQSVDILSGKEIWRRFVAGPVWSSPLILGPHLYIGDNEGILLCLDLTTGKNEPYPFVVNAKLFSSPVLGDSSIFIGADNGIFYCLRSGSLSKTLNRYVYWDQTMSAGLFRHGVDQLIKEWLSRKGFTLIDRKKLQTLVADNQFHGADNMIVLVSSQLPPSFLKTDSVNILHEFLRSGGYVVDLGNNDIVHIMDEKGNLFGFAYKQRDAILGTHSGENNLRSFGGFFSAHATAEGIALGLPESWISHSPLEPREVDLMLGTDERGRAASWLKKIGSGIYLQLWIDQEFPMDYNFVSGVLANLEKKFMN